MKRRRIRRRPARRKFHSLQLDLLFVAGVVALLLLEVVPGARRPAAPPEARGGAEAPVFAFAPEEMEPEGIFEPDSAVRRAGVAGRAPAVPPPPDLAFAPGPPPAPGPVRPPEPVPPALPRSAMPSFPPARPLFSEAPPPIGSVGADAASGAGAEVFLFKSADGAFPVVFVDAPGVPLQDIPALEREAAAMGAAAAGTAAVFHAVIPAP